MSQPAGADLEPRDTIACDVVIVGAGPAGLATAIRLKQLDPALSVIVLEKGAEVGAHILSGAVIDPVGLDRLLPDWRQDASAPLTTPVSDDRFCLLTARRAWRVPPALLPPMMHNSGNFVASLGRVCRWLAARAEALGVDIYAGFAAIDVLRAPSGAVTGIVTGDMGVEPSGAPGPDFQRGAAIEARYTVLAEGARGSVAGDVIEADGLAGDTDHQKYGIGLKELWRVAPERHHPGLVFHSIGWPLDNRTGGGGFLYHLDNNQVAIGLVVHLNYADPYLSPFEELQRFKTHPALRGTFAGAERLAYGARAISEGGWQSVPRLALPGGVLVGDCAGFVNVPRIKGSHNALLSGMLAAESLAAALAAGRAHDVLADYDAAWRAGPIGADLRPARNVKPLWSRFGTLAGAALGGFDLWCQRLTGGSPFGTLGHGGPDHAALEPAGAHRPRSYPRPDGVLTFDRLSSVFLSGTHHADQPPHLQLRDPALQQASELAVYDGPSTRYCPAGVFEWTTDAAGAPRFVVNAENCIHCKTCAIKDPNRNIRWTPPQGGDGPVYDAM